MVAVPAALPVTAPFVLTVATVVFDESQGLVIAFVPEPVNDIVVFLYSVVAPVMVGLALTVPETDTVLEVAPVEDKVMLPPAGLDESAAIRT